MKLDQNRLNEIVQTYSKLDPLKAYYQSYEIPSQTLNPLPCHAEEVIAEAMTANSHVLDVGCGDGYTLLNLADRFLEGVGIDESAYIIDVASRAAEDASVNNVKFLKEKVINLSFDDDSFDFVFSERGPLGHDDDTLVEASRVLKPGGRIFIETMGYHFMKEYEPPNEQPTPDTLLKALDTERERFQRLSIEPTLLVNQVKVLQFRSVYDWFAYHCAVERYMENPLPEPSDEAFIQAFVENASDEAGILNLTDHLIWMGGVLKL